MSLASKQNESRFRTALYFAVVLLVMAGGLWTIVLWPERNPVGATSVAPLSPAELKEAKAKILSGINEVCKQEKLKPVGIDCEITLDTNGYFRGLQNNGLSEQLHGKNRPLYDLPDPPKWKTEDACRIANALILPIKAHIPFPLGSAGASFQHLGQQKKKVETGQWTVSWPRVDSKGYPFYFDGVFMSLPEGNGPLWIEVKGDTLDYEEKGNPISAADAVEIASSRNAGQNRWSSLTAYLSGYREGRIDTVPCGAYLQIVPTGKDSPARLAWVLWYWVHNPEHTKYQVAVWIDAHNRNILGGDEVGMDSPDP